MALTLGKSGPQFDFQQYKNVVIPSEWEVGLFDKMHSSTLILAQQMAKRRPVGSKKDQNPQ